MGIYPETTYELPNGDKINFLPMHSYSEFVIVITEPGLVKRATVTRGPWVETRTDCYCCSCGDFNSDPACRNHGFAGRRPCDIHNLPGDVWGDELGDDPAVGTMPEPVSIARAKRSG